MPFSCLFLSPTKWPATVAVVSSPWWWWKLAVVDIAEYRYVCVSKKPQKKQHQHPNIYTHTHTLSHTSTRTATTKVFSTLNMFERRFNSRNVFSEIEKCRRTDQKGKKKNKCLNELHLPETERGLLLEVNKRICHRFFLVFFFSYSLLCSFWIRSLSLFTWGKI